MSRQLFTNERPKSKPTILSFLLLLFNENVFIESGFVVAFYDVGLLVTVERRLGADHWQRFDRHLQG